jgi:parvulin-like peptidyl-prolyl isomerase
MEWVAQGELLPELDAALFSLPVGTVSEPIQTRLGFHLVKIEERRTASDLSPTDANRAVFQQLYQQKFEAAMRYWLSELQRHAYIEIPRGT